MYSSLVTLDHRFESPRLKSRMHRIMISVNHRGDWHTVKNSHGCFVIIGTQSRPGRVFKVLKMAISVEGIVKIKALTGCNGLAGSDLQDGGGTI